MASLDRHYELLKALGLLDDPAAEPPKDEDPERPDFDAGPRTPAPIEDPIADHNALVLGIDRWRRG